MASVTVLIILITGAACGVTRALQCTDNGEQIICKEGNNNYCYVYYGTYQSFNRIVEKGCASYCEAENLYYDNTYQIFMDRHCCNTDRCNTIYEPPSTTECIVCDSRDDDSPNHCASYAAAGTTEICPDGTVTCKVTWAPDGLFGTRRVVRECSSTACSVLDLLPGSPECCHNYDNCNDDEITFEAFCYSCSSQDDETCMTDVGEHDAISCPPETRFCAKEEWKENGQVVRVDRRCAETCTESEIDEPGGKNSSMHRSCCADDECNHATVQQCCHLVLGLLLALWWFFLI